MTIDDSERTFRVSIVPLPISPGDRSGIPITVLRSTTASSDSRR